MATCKLSQGLVSRLESTSLPLEDKSRLAVNVFTCRVAIPGKHQIVLGWIIKLLEIKHTQRMACSDKEREESEEKIWNVLEACIKYLEVQNKKVALESSAIPGFLLNLLPHIDLASEKTSSIISSLIYLFFSPNMESDLWRQFLIQLLRSDKCSSQLAAPVISSQLAAPVISSQLAAPVISSQLAAPVISSHLAAPVVHLLEQLELTTEEDCATVVSGLAKLYPLCGADLRERMIGITRRILFPDGEDYAALFQQLRGAAVDVKYQPSGVAAVLVSCLKMPGSLVMVARSCGNVGMELKINILLLGLWLMGQDLPDLINVKSVLGGRLSAMRLNLEPVNCRMDDVVGVIEAILPVDLNHELGEDLFMSKYLTTSVKFWIDKSPHWSPPVSRLVSSVSTHHPHLLEPVIGPLLVKYLNSTSSPPLVFSSLLGVMVQMRQVPKLFVRLLLQLRQLATPLQGGWTPSDLQELSSAVTQLPRVQCLEIWKTLVYHLSADCLPNVASNPVVCENVAAVVGPVLAALLESAQLTDHNLPSNLQTRIVGLVNDTLNQILEPINAMEKVGNPLQMLMYQITFSLTELCLLLLNYRQLEGLSQMISFHKSLVSKICKSSTPQTQLIQNLLAQRLKMCDVDSSDLAEVIPKCDKQVLQNNLHILHLVHDHLPPTILTSLVQSVLSVQPGLAEEHPKISAAIISEIVTRLKIAPLANQPDIWLDPRNWDALDGDLGKKLISCCAELEKESTPVDVDNIIEVVDQISYLPLENLPVVLKLGATIIAVNLFNTIEDFAPPTELCRLLSRCFETTDLFRYISGAAFYMKLAKMKLPDTPLFETVAASLARFTKTLQDVEMCLEELESGVATENVSSIKAAAVLLVALVRPLSQSGLAKEKKEVAENVSRRLAKCLAKVAKKVGSSPGEGGAAEEWCVAAAAAVLKIYHKDLGKLNKLVVKMFNSALCLVNSGNPHAANLLTEIPHHPELCAELPSDWRVSMWTQITATSSCGAQHLLPSLLTSATPPELTQMLADLSKATLSGSITPDVSSALWQHVVNAKVEEESFPTRLHAVELILPHLFLHANHVLDLMNSIFSSTPPVISPAGETSCITHLATLAASPDTLSSLHLLLTHRPNQAVRLLPTVTGLIRRFLNQIKTSDSSTNETSNQEDTKAPNQEETCSIEDAIVLSNGLERLLGLASRRKDDWARVAPYVLADILNAFQIGRMDPQVKTGLTQCCHSLLDMCDKHSLDYVAANLPAATKEIFKHLLHNYNTQHKFTGRV